MLIYTDQIGRSIELKKVPERIISLVPSQTELLYDLGLDNEVVGITKFCVHPEEWFRTKPRIGGTKQIHFEKIRELQPDLVIANKEENVQDQVDMIAQEFPVWVSDVNTLEEAYKMIASIGLITNRINESNKMISSIKERFSSLKPVKNKLRTCYLIWKDPYMTIGGDTFIHDMLEHAGFENMFAYMNRYPVINLKQLSIAHCQLLLLSSEPYPFSQKHLSEIGAILPGIKILLADGEMFSWYGSRLEKAPAYFEQLRNDILSLTHAGN